MNKKLKAFTLVELIVAIAVFGILMTGIIRMIEPLSSTTTNAAVLNNQRTVENAIITYIGENLRYASNLAIIEGGTPDQAVQKFISLQPSDNKGMQIEYVDNTNGAQANKDKIRVIAFDRSNTYTYKNNSFSGRLIATTEDKSGSISLSNLNSDGSTNQYLVFGNDYYAQGNYNLNARICNGALYLSVDSDYFYTPNNSGKFSSTASTPTRGVYELRSMTNGSSGFVFACLKSTESTNTNNIASVGRSDSDVIYFVYTYPDDKVTNNGSIANGLTGGNADCTPPTD